jgi:hypothetical protein
MKEKAGMMGLAIITAALLTAISVTVNAIADSKGQSQSEGEGRNADQSRDRDRDREREVDRLQYPIYGSQMMSEREREMHRSKMRSFKTEQEREVYRTEHHKQMQERARAKGISLPDEPPKLTPPANSPSK